MVLKNLFTGSNRETDKENRLVEMGRREERVRCMERVTWKLTLPCVKQTPIEKLMYGSGNSNRASVSIWRGRMEREMGEGFIEGRGYMYTYV